MTEIPSLNTTVATVPLEQLHPWPGNARRGDVDTVRASLRKHGQYRPLVVQASTMRVIAGNHTLQALQEEGAGAARVELVDVDDDTAERINLVDNRASDKAGYDTQALLDQLQQLPDLDGTGYQAGDVDRLLADLEKLHELDDKVANDQQPEHAPDDPITQPGDIIQLGDHTLACGSALDLDLWHAMLGDRRGRLVVTSPPYNQKLDGFGKSGIVADRAAGWADRMANAYADSKPEPEYQDEQVELLDTMFALTTDDGGVFYNHKHRYRDGVVVSPLEWIWRTQWKLRQEVIWSRAGSLTQNARMFNPSDERLYWLRKPGADTAWVEHPEHKSWMTVWQIVQQVDVKVSAPFPIELPDRAIRALSSAGDVVLEPYCGSGTTLMACEARGRTCVATEISEAYCDVIIERWRAATGGQPRLVRRGGEEVDREWPRGS